MEEFLMLPVPRRLKALIQPLAAIVECVDEVTSGFGEDAVDYGLFEEQAAAKAASVEQAMHAVALSEAGHRQRVREGLGERPQAGGALRSGVPLHVRPGTGDPVAVPEG